MVCGNSGKAIIIVDVLNDFVTGSLRCDRAQRIVPHLVDLVKNAREKGIPVIYSNDAHIKGIDHELKEVFYNVMLSLVRMQWLKIVLS